MSNTLFCKPTDPAVSMLLQKTFGATTLTKVAVTVYDSGGMSLTSYWSGGTRDYHMVVRLADMAVYTVPENGSGFATADLDWGSTGMPVDLPAPGYAVVTHTTGSYKAMSVCLHRDNAAKLLPAPCELAWAERVVLAATRCLKSSYGGVKDYRFTEARQQTGITRDEWDIARGVLIGRKLLNAAGAITIDGRNAAGAGDLYRLRREVVA